SLTTTTPFTKTPVRSSASARRRPTPSVTASASWLTASTIYRERSSSPCWKKRRRRPRNVTKSVDEVVEATSRSALRVAPRLAQNPKGGRSRFPDSNPVDFTALVCPCRSAAGPFLPDPVVFFLSVAARMPLFDSPYPPADCSSLSCDECRRRAVTSLP